jgi:hypothetical protein
MYIKWTEELDLEAECLVDQARLREVPRWILKNLLVPRGVRLDKKVRFDEARQRATIKCSVCLMDTFPGERLLRGGLLYHRPCHDRKFSGELDDPTNTSGLTRGGIVIRPQKDAEVQGNLGDAEYHHWIGSRLSTSTFAMCRCCRKVTNSSNERQLHKLEKQTAGLPCCVILRQAMRMIAPKHRCVICGKSALDMHYGVNICDWWCANDWKFKTDDHLDLKIAITNIRAGLLQAERNKFRKENERAEVLFD